MGSFINLGCFWGITETCIKNRCPGHYKLTQRAESLRKGARDCFEGKDTGEICGEMVIMWQNGVLIITLSGKDGKL